MYGNMADPTGGSKMHGFQHFEVTQAVVVIAPLQFALDDSGKRVASMVGVIELEVEFVGSVCEDDMRRPMKFAKEQALFVG